MKKCSKCNQKKRLECFSFQNKLSNLYMSSCKECQSKERKHRRQTQSLIVRKKDKEVYYRNRDKKIKYAREYRRNNKAKTRNINLKSKYGITQEWYDSQKHNQNNKCAVCFQHEKDLKRILCVDHCHNTGKVRGLLCDTCNKFLGFYEKLQEKCKDYLKNYNRCNNSYTEKYGETMSISSDVTITRKEAIKLVKHKLMTEHEALVDLAVNAMSDSLLCTCLHTDTEFYHIENGEGDEE